MRDGSGRVSVRADGSPASAAAPAAASSTSAGAAGGAAPVPPRATGEYAAVGAGDAGSRLTPARGVGLRARGPALRLFCVASLDAGRPEAPTALATDTDLVAFRDVAAVVAVAPYVPDPVTPPELDRHRLVIDEVFAARAVVPAPPGTLFRSRETLVGWLELHYFTLAEALRFVEDRAAARVTVTRAAERSQGARRAPLRLAPGREDEPDVGDVVSLAAEAFGVLRREAVALLVLRADEALGDDAAHASFLVERARWARFEQALATEAEQRPALRFAMSGPWPPYDFVRMQFRG
jgi:hypothetical protein